MAEVIKNKYNFLKSRFLTVMENIYPRHFRNDDYFCQAIKKLAPTIENLNDKTYTTRDIANMSGLSTQTVGRALEFIETAQTFVPPIEIDTKDAEKKVTVKDMPLWFYKKK